MDEGDYVMSTRCSNVYHLKRGVVFFGTTPCKEGWYLISDQGDIINNQHYPTEEEAITAWWARD